MITDKIRDFVNKYFKQASIIYIVSIAIYSLLLSNQLTNTYDGLWRNSYSMADGWELSIGRWLLLWIDRLIKGLHTDPLNSMICILLYVIGYMFIVDLFQLKDKTSMVLSGIAFMDSVSLLIILSYRHTSLGYSIGFLFSVIAGVIFARSKKVGGYLITAIFVALQMACYQAYLACTVMIIAVYFIYLLVRENEDRKFYVRYIVTALASVILGGILYYAILRIHLSVLNIELSSYHGANAVNVTEIVKGLPENITKCLNGFKDYYFSFKINTLGAGFSCVVLIVIALSALIESARMLKKNIWRGLLAIGAFIVIPVLCNASLILAVGNSLALQMTAGLELFIPIMALMFMSIQEKPCFAVKAIVTLLLCFVIYGNSLQVLTDEEAMKDGRAAAENMALEIVSDLCDMGLYRNDMEIFFIGKPSANAMFNRTVAYNNANAYAQVGNFALGGNCMLQSYYGLMNTLVGSNFLITGRSYEDFSSSDFTISMPSFPNEGYIQCVDNIIFVKVSEP